MKIILFDFDKTLTKRDTLRPLAHFLAGEYRSSIGLVYLYFVFLLARFQIISDKGMKEVFLRVFLKGKNSASVSSDVKAFLEKNLELLLNVRIFEALQQHRKNGDKVFIVSANFDFLLEPLVQFWGINGVICTVTEKMGGVFTGRIVGETCKGKAKVERIRAMFSSQDISNMKAFGDREDKEMLGLVNEAILI